MLTLQVQGPLLRITIAGISDGYLLRKKKITALLFSEVLLTKLYSFEIVL